MKKNFFRDSELSLTDAVLSGTDVRDFGGRTALRHVEDYVGQNKNGET